MLFKSSKNLSSFRNLSGKIPSLSSLEQFLSSTLQMATPTTWSMSSARKLQPLERMFLMSSSRAGILYPGGQRSNPAAQGSSGKKSVNRRSITLLNQITFALIEYLNIIKQDARFRWYNSWRLLILDTSIDRFYRYKSLFWTLTGFIFKSINF